MTHTPLLTSRTLGHDSWPCPGNASHILQYILPGFQETVCTVLEFPSHIPVYMFMFTLRKPTKQKQPRSPTVDTYDMISLRTIYLSICEHLHTGTTSAWKEGVFPKTGKQIHSHRKTAMRNRERNNMTKKSQRNMPVCVWTGTEGMTWRVQTHKGTLNKKKKEGEEVKKKKKWLCSKNSPTVQEFQQAGSGDNRLGAPLGLHYVTPALPPLPSAAGSNRHSIQATPLHSPLLSCMGADRQQQYLAQEQGESTDPFCCAGRSCPRRSVWIKGNWHGWWAIGGLPFCFPHMKKKK